MAAVPNTLTIRIVPVIDWAALASGIQACADALDDLDAAAKGVNTELEAFGASFNQSPFSD